MKNSIVRYFFLLLTTTTLISCGEASLQKYLVAKQDDSKFLKIDLSPSMLEGKDAVLGEETEAALKNIKKINVVAYPLKNGTREDFDLEREELELILLQDRYIELTRIRNKGWNLQVSYTGDENEIDEVIVYAMSKNDGFAVFRLLGKDLKPEALVPIVQAAVRGDINLSELQQFGEIFGG